MRTLSSLPRPLLAVTHCIAVRLSMVFDIQRQHFARRSFISDPFWGSQDGGRVRGRSICGDFVSNSAFCHPARSCVTRVYFYFPVNAQQAISIDSVDGSQPYQLLVPSNFPSTAKPQMDWTFFAIVHSQLRACEGRVGQRRCPTNSQLNQATSHSQDVSV